MGDLDGSLLGSVISTVDIVGEGVEIVGFRDDCIVGSADGSLVGYVVGEFKGSAVLGSDVPGFVGDSEGPFDGNCVVVVLTGSDYD